MEWRKLLKGADREEQIEKKTQQLEIEKLNAEIREQKMRGKPKEGDKKKSLGETPNFLGFN